MSARTLARIPFARILISGYICKDPREYPTCKDLHGWEDFLNGSWQGSHLQISLLLRAYSARIPQGSHLQGPSPVRIFARIPFARILISEDFCKDPCEDLACEDLHCCEHFLQGSSQGSLISFTIFQVFCTLTGTTKKKTITAQSIQEPPHFIQSMPSWQNQQLNVLIVDVPAPTLPLKRPSGAIACSNTV